MASGSPSTVPNMSTSPVAGLIAEIRRYPVKSMAGENLTQARLADQGIPGDRGWALRDEQAGEIRGAKKLPALMRCTATYTEEPAEGAPIPMALMTLPDGSTLNTGDPDAAAKLSKLVEREVTLWPRLPSDDKDHYRRGTPDNEDFEAELRQIFGRTPDEPLPDLSVFPTELMEFGSPLGTYFDAFPLHILTTASLKAISEYNPTARFEVSRFRPNLVIETDPALTGLVEAEWGGRRLKIGDAIVEVTTPTVRCVMTTQETTELPKDPSVLRTIVHDADQNLGAYARTLTAGSVRIGDEVSFVD